MVDDGAHRVGRRAVLFAAVMVEASGRLVDLFEAAAKTDDSHRWRDEGERMARSVRQALWDDSVGLFRATKGLLVCSLAPTALIVPAFSLLR